MTAQNMDPGLKQLGDSARIDQSTVASQAEIKDQEDRLSAAKQGSAVDPFSGQQSPYESGQSSGDPDPLAGVPAPLGWAGQRHS